MDLMLDQFVPEQIAFIHAGNLYHSYDSIWESLRPLKDRIPLNRISFQMTEWYPVNEESYLAISMSFDLENKNNRPCSMYTKAIDVGTSWFTKTSTLDKPLAK